MFKLLFVKRSVIVVFTIIVIQACNTPKLFENRSNFAIPKGFNGKHDTLNSGQYAWKEYFTDPYLNNLIDSALVLNQELNITLLEIGILKNEVRAKKGEYLPSVGVGVISGVEKVGRFTSKGANDATTDIKPGMEMPEPLGEFQIGLQATWEVDIWKKLRNSKKSALTRYLASVQGKNFMQTNLIAEIAHAYYELLALDNQLVILQKSIALQEDALKIVRLQKEAAQVNELAVKRFEAQLLHSKSLQYDLKQKIVEIENRMNFLVGRFPQKVLRTNQNFNELLPNAVYVGTTSQLLQNRPDIKQAELELMAAKIDVKVAKANFYPKLDISASFGLQAFKPEYLLNAPESMLYGLAGDLVAPLINRNAIKAMYANANTKQIQAIYNYEQTVLKAYIEVVNQLSNLNNLELRYRLQSKSVEALNESTNIANKLYKSARADYMEVLMTQRDALESQFELVETKLLQMHTMVNVYRVLGGGWK